MLLEPERHIGSGVPAHVGCRRRGCTNFERVAQSGLRGVNFPPPRVGPDNLEYNNPAWEPFWLACESYGMSLNHALERCRRLFDYFGARAAKIS